MPEIKTNSLPFKFVFPVIILIYIISGCSSPLSPEYLVYSSVLQGQAYNISHAGPIPIGWTPPPLETVSTIIVLNPRKNVVKEIQTDIKGRFKIELSAGSYFLRIKESPVQVETGPYYLSRGLTVSAEADYDNGMR